MATAKRMCCVIDCPVKNGEPEGPVYEFPRPPSARHNRWLAMCPNSFQLRNSGANYICKRHFSADAFDNTGKLKSNAVPTKNVKKSLAEEQILETFLIKVIYEWTVRTNNLKPEEIRAAAMEGARILGMKDFNASGEWIKKFKIIRHLNQKNGLRFVGEMASGRKVVEIIRDLRTYLPENFIIPMGAPGRVDEPVVKNECLSDDDTVDVYLELNSDSDLIVIEEPKIEPIDDESEAASDEMNSDRAESVEAAPAKEDEKPLGTYQEALELLKPLEAYILSLGNEKAMARIREITSVVQAAVETELRPRKGVKRSRVA